MKTLASLMILSFCLVFPLAAQTDKNVEDEIPRSVNEATMIGIGGYNVMDTYLTPGIETKYTGWGVRIQNERMKIVRLAPAVSQCRVCIYPECCGRGNRLCGFCGLFAWISLPIYQPVAESESSDRPFRSFVGWFYL